MSKKKKKSPVFTSQPYPLYAWGMWVEPVFDDNYENILEYEFNIDRLTIVGWMQRGDVVQPMVSTVGYGVVSLYDCAGYPDFAGTWTITDEPFRDFISEDFLLADISMSEPDSDVYAATKNAYVMLQNHRRKLTVVEEGHRAV
jgi:hypothetical protein